jgi:glycosyltransferase involved in cell wall biosynthesis
MLLGFDASRGIRQEKTGVEWYSWHLLHAMEQITPPDWRVDLYIPANYQLGELQITNPNWQLKILNWPIKYLWTQGRLSWEMFRRPPDVLFVPSHVLPLKHPSKTIITIHDIGFERFPECYQKTELWYQHWACDFAVKKASYIIVPSEFTKQELRAVFKAPAEKIIVIPHGIDLDFWSQVPSEKELKERREKYNLRENYCIFLGRLEAKKNIRRLIEAWQIANLEGIDLFLAGMNNNQMGKFINSLQLKQVKNPGWLPREDLRILLHGAKALFFPSLYEGFGLPLLEAMAAGVPLLVSDIPVHHEIVQEAALFVDPFSLNSIVEGIKRIVEDEKLRKKLIQKGYERVTDFSWKKSGQKTWEIIQMVGGL